MFKLTLAVCLSEHPVHRSRTTVARLKETFDDQDQLANEQLPNGVDGPVSILRGK